MVSPGGTEEKLSFGCRKMPPDCRIIGRRGNRAFYDGWAGRDLLRWAAMDFLKSIGGKVATGAVGLTVVIAAIAYWQASPETRSAVFNTIGKIVGWSMLMLFMPWLLFLVVQWIEKFKNNTISAAFVGALTLLEGLFLLWLFDWSPGGAMAWSLTLGAIVIAGVYNLFTCDWIAEKLA
jgi:hypothetical protein